MMAGSRAGASALFLTGFFALAPWVANADEPIVHGRPAPSHGTETSTAPGYCTASAASQSFEAITDVAIGFTADTVNVSVNVSTFQSDPGAYTEGEHVNVWVDWNGDKEFSADEQVMQGFFVPISGSTVIPNFTLSASAPIPVVEGKMPFYMRVTLSYGENAGPCGGWTFGSVRDFLILDGKVVRVNAVLDPGDPEVDIGLDKTGKTVVPIETVLELDNPKNLQIDTNQAFLQEDGADVRPQDLLPVAGEQTITFNKGIPLNFAKQHFIRGFVNRNTGKASWEYSNKAIVNLFRLRITDPAPSTILRIKPDPAMPDDKFKVKVERQGGPDPTADTRFDWTMHVSFKTSGLGARTQDETDFNTPGNVLGGTWAPDYGNTIVGGDVSATVKAVVLGQGIDAELDAKRDGVKIRGQANVPKRNVKDRLATLFRQVICFQETLPGPLRFQQFGDDGLPIHHGKAWGAMQLENPEPTKTQVWNWHENIDEGKRRIDVDKLNEVTNHYKNLRQVHPQLPALTQDQFNLAWWQRYKRGYYWDAKKVNGTWTWVKGSFDDTEYGDKVKVWFDQVSGGHPPPGWE